MTLTTTLNQVILPGDGVSQSFVIPFRYFRREDIQARIRAGGVAWAPSIEVSEPGLSGGSLTLLAGPLLAGQELAIWSDADPLQPDSYENKPSFPYDLHERALDRAAGHVRDVRAQIGRSLRFDAPGSVDTVLPYPPVASRFLRVASDGAGFEWSEGQAGPQGPQGIQGLQGATGPRGPRGFQGDKGDPGNYYGLTLIGSSDDIADRPGSASEGEFWGLYGDGTLTLYLWTSGAWQDVGTISTLAAYATANTIHVQEGGQNTNSGTSWGDAVRSIERALELATLRAEPTLIKWAAEAGIVTQGHLDMHDDCVIPAAHRSVFVSPDAGFEERNVFRMGSGCFLEGVMFEGFRVESLTDPTEGFAVSFRPGAVINRVPYAHKIAVRNAFPGGLVVPPLDRGNANPLVPRGGGVILADGSVCSQYSRFPNIMTWGATPITYNGLGYVARRGGLINAVNAVSMWAHKHFVALEGGHIILSACSTQFGDWSLVADGARNVVVPGEIAGTITPDATAADAIDAAAETIVDDMWAALVAGGYTATWDAADEAFTRSDAALFLQCLSWSIRTGDETPMLNFARGLFNTMGERVFAAGKLAAFTFSFDDMRDSVQALPAVGAAAEASVAALVAALNATLTAPATRTEPSRIEAIGHTWQNPLAGVALAKIPPVESGFKPRDSILALNGGKVVATGQDNAGNALFAGEVEVDARFGMKGRGFLGPVRRAARKAAIQYGGF